MPVLTYITQVTSVVLQLPTISVHTTHTTTTLNLLLSYTPFTFFYLCDFCLLSFTFNALLSQSSPITFPLKPQYFICMSLIFDLVLHLVMCTSYIPNCTVISVCLDLCISSQVSLSPKSMLFLLNLWYFPIAYS